MMKRQEWIGPVLPLLILILLLTPGLGLARQDSEPRIGINHVDAGLALARGSRDFNGKDVRSADLYTIHMNVQLSILQMTMASWGLFDHDNRLRIGDYLRAEFVTGWMMEEQNDVAPGAAVDLSGGSAIIAGVFALGAQANYLVTSDLEVGGAIAKATWNTTLGFGNDYHGALKPTDEPYPLLWVGRARYGRILGEYHTARTGKYMNNTSGPAGIFDYQHSYSSYKIRYFTRGGNGNLGVELDRYGYDVFRAGEPAGSGYDTNRSVMNLRISIGYSV